VLLRCDRLVGDVAADELTERGGEVVVGPGGDAGELVGLALVPFAGDGGGDGLGEVLAGGRGDPAVADTGEQNAAFADGGDAPRVVLGVPAVAQYGEGDAAGADGVFGDGVAGRDGARALGSLEPAGVDEVGDADALGCGDDVGVLTATAISAASAGWPSCPQALR